MSATRQMELGEQSPPRTFLEPPRLAPIPEGQRAKPGLLAAYKDLLKRQDIEASAQGGNHRERCMD